MISKVSSRLLRQLRIQRLFSTTPDVLKSSDVARSDRLQFTKEKLTEYGELPQGTIPEALNYDRKFSMNRLANHIRIGTESWNSELASVTVLINAGSRQETLESSGVCNFIEKLNLRGTAGRSREQVETDLANLGGNLQINTGRETTTYTLTFAKDQLEKAVDFLGDILQNSLYNGNQIEAEREGISAEHSNNTADQHKFITEAIHYTAYRDHIFGQPSKGIRENVGNVTKEQIQTYLTQNLVGSNISIAGTGGISHEALTGAVEKAFGKLPAEAPRNERNNQEKPYQTPSYMLMRDDEMTNVNIGVFFEAPSYSDPDYFAMKLVQEVIGEYRQDKYTGHHLNTPDRQFSMMHAELGQFPDITLQKCEYIPYSDTGLFGSWLHGNEVWANQMLYMSQYVLTEYASYMNPVELYRARNKIYNQLLNDTQSAPAALEIANQINYLGRRVPRSEVAKRMSHFDTGLLNRVIMRWFWDRELNAVAWGPIHHLMTYGLYNRVLRRSSVGWLGNHHYKIV